MPDQEPLADLSALLADVAGIVAAGHQELVDSHARTRAGYERLTSTLFDLSRRVAAADRRQGAGARVAALAGLDERDLAIIEALGCGVSVKQLARRFAVSERTIRERIGRLKKVTGAATMFELGAKVMARGWLVAETPAEPAESD